MSNLLIFGPAEAGKSTLGGCLLDRIMPENLKARIRSEYFSETNGIVITEKYYSSLIDKGYGEGPIRRDDDKGTTRKLKIKHLQIYDRNFSLLDVPGYQHGYRERLRGTSYASFGIFVIPINRIIKIMEANENLALYYYNQYFGNLIDWLNNPTLCSKLILVLSQFDLCSPAFSQNAFQAAREFLYSQVINDESIEIIPTSILCSEKKSINVWDDDPKEYMPWYSGLSLVEAIMQVSNGFPDEEVIIPDSQGLFAQCNEFFRNPEDSGPVIAGKVVSGIISYNMKAKLIFSNESYGVTIRSLRKRGGRSYYLSSESEQYICENQLYSALVGLPKGISDKIIKLRKKPGSLPMSLVNSDQKCVLGKIARFELVEECNKITIFSDVFVLWYDKVISGTVISKYTSCLENKTYIIVELRKRISVPCDQDGVPLFSESYFFDQNKELSDAYSYASEFYYDNDFHTLCKRQWRIRLDKLGECGSIVYRIGLSDALEANTCIERIKQIYANKKIINKTLAVTEIKADEHLLEIYTNSDQSTTLCNYKTVKLIRENIIRQNCAVELDWKVHISPYFV